jgi:hypothetical protein
MKQLHSALFIDYDNVRPELDRYDPAIGTRFTNKPLVWLDALEKSMPLPAGVEAEARRIVSRRCYASPHMINDHRRNFTQTGFEVIDCPPLTRSAKNSADIYIVMEIIDYLQRYPKIEEYIILSGDADFVPVLNRLRKELKKSVIFASYNTTAAYKNCSDRTIEADFFAEHLAVERVAPRAAQSAVAKPAPPTPKAPAPKAPAPKAPAPAAPAPPAPAGLAVPPGAELVEAIIECLRRAAQRGFGRLSFAGAKAALREGLPTQFAGNWAGYKSFIALIEQIDLAPLEVDRKHQFILDPDFEIDLKDWDEEEREELKEFIEDILRTAAKAIPVLRPAEYSMVFSALAAHYGKDGTGTLNDAVTAVAETCRARKFAITAMEVRFIATGIIMQDPRGEEAAEPKHLAALWRAQIFRLCHEPDWLHEPEDAALLAYWCHADGEDLDEAREDFLRRTGGDGGSEEPLAMG